MRVWGFASCGLLLVGCAQLLTLDDYDDVASPAPASVGGAATGGTAGTGGSGGSGLSGGSAASSGSGAGAGVLAADWTASLTAVYHFESQTNIGEDANGSLDLTAQGMVQRDDVEFVQGSYAMLLAGAEGSVASGNAAFNPGATASATFGGWFRATGGLGLVIRKRNQNPGGYGLRRYTMDGANCEFYSDATPTSVHSAGGWPADTWIHFVCRIDNSRDEIMIARDGQFATSAFPFDVMDTDAPFSIGNNVGEDYAGQVDEVFFHNAALGDAVIRRIWACGIDGSRCLCNPTKREEYANCGRAGPGCNSLSPCDQSEP